ncbi:Splicing factor 3A subunit 2 [Kappamyces sp. JEL0680]|nr:Splicing factor 3A subunit 2 [Kappamyces sp. JEL0680]
MPIRKILVKIGRPGYKVIKIRDPMTRQSGLLFQVYYPELVQGDKPHYRFMSSYEQRIEPPSKFFQYLLVAGEPYETIAFKVQSLEVDRSEGKLWSYWDPDTKQYFLQFFFKS